MAAWHLLRVLLVVLGVLGVGALIWLLADAALDLSASSRVAAPWVLLGCAAVIVVAGLLRLRRFTESFIARLFESRDRSLGNRLTNAVQLARRSGATSIEEFLRRESVELGRGAAADLEAWPVARQPVLRAVRCFGVVTVAWLLTAWLALDVLQSVWPRFLNPHDDHPPFSRLQIEVSPGAAEVLYGGQIDIRATARGLPVEKLWLVAGSRTNATRALMFLAPDRSFFQTLANVREPAEYYVTDGRARSRRFPISVRYTPQITLVEVTTLFPEYTAKPPRTAKLADEPQAFPEGTRVQFRVASNRPLQSGALTLTPALGGKPSAAALEPGGQPNSVSGEFTLDEPVLFQLSVRDVEGLECAEPRQGRFNIQPDARPRLIVLEPGRDAVATPSIRVPIRVQAQDDYGIARMIWLRSHNHSIERPFDMRIDLKGGPHSVESSGAFDLEKLGVQPGDVIEYYFEAADNYPKGPNIALSRFYRLEIISHEQYELILRQAAARKALFEPYFQLSNWLRRIAERARHLEDQDPNDPATLAAARELAEQLDQYHNELGKVMRQAILFDIEQSFRETLVATHQRAGRAAQDLKKSLGEGGLSREQLERLSEELGDLAQLNTEQVELPAREMANVARLLARSNRFVQLAREQATLARLLQRFAEEPASLSRIEQIEMQELAHQQRRVQHELRDLLASLPELVGKLPPEPEYDPLRADVAGFIEAVNEAYIDADMSAAVIGLDELSGVIGHGYAKSAAEKMDALINKCNGIGETGQLCLSFRPSMQQAGNTLQQILSAMGAGHGGDGSDGYSLFNEDMGLYGPDVELAGQPAGGGGDMSGDARRRFEQVAGDTDDPGIRGPEGPGRVRLRPDGKFPLRYRDVVGEYFRAIAEAESEEGAR